jgi:putative membrane protein insertion efficiency factor
MHGERMGWKRRALAAALGAICVYLSLESLLPPERQPTASIGLAAIRGYQAVGSPALAGMGVRCRYTPTCSHYAAAALSHYGTLEGVARTAGRLWRCSPWGGSGYDPAVASLTRQEASPAPPRRIGDDLTEEEKRALRQVGKEAGWCALACLIPIFISFVVFAAWIVALVYIVKDAKARGDPNAVLWIVLAVMVPLIGVVVYFFARPKGELTPCGHCKNRKLETLVKCPHCGADAAGGAVKTS